jgi:Golgi phosphoprotein 3 (GPP34)
MLAGQAGAGIRDQLRADGRGAGPAGRLRADRIVDDQVVVTSPAPTGDADLDAALARIGEPPLPPWADEWVARPRPCITGRYLERLIAAGVVGEQTRFGVTRWPITGTARLAEARQRLDLLA